MQNITALEIIKHARISMLNEATEKGWKKYNAKYNILNAKPSFKGNNLNISLDYEDFGVKEDAPYDLYCQLWGEKNGRNLKFNVVFAAVDGKTSKEDLAEYSVLLKKIEAVIGSSFVKNAEVGQTDFKKQWVITSEDEFQKVLDEAAALVVKIKKLIR